MSTHKHINIICVVIVLISVLVTVLFMNGEKLGLTAVVDEDAESYTGDSIFTTNDLDGDWDTSDATVITLSDDGITISGDGAYEYDGDLVISQAGTYVISGTLSNGSIIVDAYDSSKVWILLNGVDITCEDDAAIQIDQADKVFLTLAEGTENYLTTGDSYSEEAVDDGTGGAIYSHDDLTINGSGSLTITTSYEHGIEVNDSLVITGGNITITCPEDGLHVNDSIAITGATLTISAEDDGIHCDGSVTIAGGTILITDAYEGIEGSTIEVTDGDITIYCSDDGFNATDGSSTDVMGGGNMGGNMDENMDGNMGGMGRGMQNNQDSSSDDTSSSDTQDSTSSTSSSDDTASSTSSSDSSSSTTKTKTTADTIYLTVYDSTDSDSSDEDTTTTDDTDTTSTDEDSEESEVWIHISGGTVRIYNESGMDADGLDSNGDIIISGGYVYISLNNTGMNNALDYGSENNGVLEINGGTVVAAGSSGMLESVSDTSTQASITYTLSDGAEAGSTVTLTDSEGNVILSYTVEYAFSAVTLSTEGMEVGETYTLTIGDTTEEITLSEVVYSNSTSGGMMGGGMGRGNFSSDTTEDSTDSSSSSDTSEDTTTNDASGSTDSSSLNRATTMSAVTTTAVTTTAVITSDTDSSDTTTAMGPGGMGGNGGNMQGGNGGTPPDMSGSTDGTAPDFSESGDMEMPDMVAESEEESEETSTDSETTIFDLDLETWLIIGGCFLALILAILFVKFYKKY